MRGPALLTRTAAAVALLAALALPAGTGAGRATRLQPTTPVLRQLALLPDAPSLHRQVLVGDLGRLSATYPSPRAFWSASCCRTKFCVYCLLVAAASVVSVPLALPEMRAALATLRDRA